jgi:hypothetical protein
MSHQAVLLRAEVGVQGFGLFWCTLDNRTAVARLKVLLGGSFDCLVDAIDERFGIALAI